MDFTYSMRSTKKVTLVVSDVEWTNVGVFEIARHVERSQAERHELAEELVDNAFKCIGIDKSQHALCFQRCVSRLLDGNFDRCHMWTHWSELEVIGRLMVRLDKEARYKTEDFALPAELGISVFVMIALCKVRAGSLEQTSILLGEHRWTERLVTTVLNFNPENPTAVFEVVCPKELSFHAIPRAYLGTAVYGEPGTQGSRQLYGLQTEIEAAKRIFAAYPRAQSGLTTARADVPIQIERSDLMERHADLFEQMYRSDVDQDRLGIHLDSVLDQKFHRVLAPDLRAATILWAEKYRPTLAYRLRRLAPGTDIKSYSYQPLGDNPEATPLYEMEFIAHDIDDMSNIEVPAVYTRVGFPKVSTQIRQCLDYFHDCREEEALERLGLEEKVAVLNDENTALKSENMALKAQLAKANVDFQIAL